MRTPLFLFLFMISLCCYSQDTTYTRYLSTFNFLSEKINKLDSGSFSMCVFKVENTFANNSLSEEDFTKKIRALSIIAKSWLMFNPLSQYRASDSANFAFNMAIYKVLKDTITLEISKSEQYYTTPYTYDFNDFFGYNDWSNMFVTKLLTTHKGNCHSLPYLYKMLADELGATCWLSLAPNHMYIKNRSQKIGWYNTELTSGEFPIDAWIATSGYVPIDAIRNGIYMDTLSNQQVIALCVLDLAKGYEFQTKNYDDGFILKCCDLVLKYHPINVQAILLKAETFKRQYEKLPRQTENGKACLAKMEKLYSQLFDLGYREMPEKMYLQWLGSVTKQRKKYGNKQLKPALNKK